MPIGSPSQLSPRLQNKTKKNAAKYRQQVKQEWREWESFEDAIAHSTPTQKAAWLSFEQYRLIINNHKTYNHMREWQSALNTTYDSRYLWAIAGVDTLILSPRESAKSTYLAQWVSYQYGMHLSPWVRLALKVLGVSYNIDTAMPRSRQIQSILKSSKYQEIFPWVRPSKRKWGEKEWMVDLEWAGLATTEEQYSYVCAGLTGAINSRRCLVGDTMVETEIGEIPISELKNHIGIKVLTFNESTRQVEWRPVTGFASRPSDRIFEIRTSGGREVQCTPDHPFFVCGQGYTEARHLVPGDTVVIAPSRKRVEQGVLGVSQEFRQEKQREDLQDLLPVSKKDRIRNLLQGLHKSIHSICCRFQQKAVPKNIKQQFFLFFGVFSSRCKKNQIVSRLQNSDTQQRRRASRMSLPRVLATFPQFAQTNQRQELFSMRSPVLSSQSRNNILFERMCKQSTLTEDAWRRQQSLQTWRKLQQRISRLTKQSDGERWTRLCGVSYKGSLQINQALREAVKSHSTSHQPQSSRRSLRQFDNPVQELSYHAPQDCCRWETDTISSVAELHGRQEEVFDIEVAGNHNFFANQILSHNCHLVLLDDLIKSPEAIRARSVRDAMVSNWENVIQFTRYDGSRAVCLGTRMTADDIYCTTFTPEKGWSVIEQSALLEHPDGTEYSFWEPEHDKAPGMPLARLQQERETTPIAFAFQRQNKIIRVKQQSIDPALIQRGIIPTRFDTLVLGVDLSAGLKDSNDYTAMVLGGVLMVGDRLNYWIIDTWEDRVMGNTAKLDAMIEIWEMWKHLLPTTKTYIHAAGEWEDTPISGLELWFDSSAYGLSLQGDYESHIVERHKITNWHVRPVPASGRGGKLERLRKHSGLFDNKLVYFNLYGRTMNDGRRPLGRLIQQITEFGSTSHDDLADSFELCVSGLRSHLPMSKGNY